TLDDHVASCSRCASFQTSALRIRHSVRLEPATEVPNLVGRIMDGVRAGRRPPRARPELRPWIRPAAAFVAGAAAAALVLAGLPIARRGVPPAFADDVPRLVSVAAQEVSSYRATLDVTERNFHPQVPVRRFVA